MDHVIVFVSLVVAIAPMMAILLFIWWIDRYDREPLKYVFFAFFWGGFGAVILSILGTEVSIKVLGGAIYSPHFDTTAVLVAPAIEELMKGLIVLFFLRLRHFDNMTDGLLYGGEDGAAIGQPRVMPNAADARHGVLAAHGRALVAHAPAPAEEKARLRQETL